MKAPWRDYAGNEIYDGDVISHPTGERGKVVFLPDKPDDRARWRVDYGDGGHLSSLGLQIGDKGQAVVVETEHPIEFIGPSGMDAETLALSQFMDDHRRKIAEAFSPSPRVITRVMDDGIETKDGAA